MTVSLAVIDIRLCVQDGVKEHVCTPEMSSALHGGGLNYQRGNPLGNHVRVLESDVAVLKRQIAVLMERSFASSGPAVAGAVGPACPPGSCLQQC